MLPGGLGVFRSGVAVAAAVLVLTGCAGEAVGSGAASAATSDSSSSTVAPAPDPIAWNECGPNLDCATVEVPLEYTEPDGTQIPLAVMRHRATDPTQRIGSLFFNPGGPGVAATDTLRNMPATAGAPGTFSPDLLARFDVIAMDPRGVGQSDAVRCLTDEQRAEAASTESDPAVPGGKPLPRVAGRRHHVHRRLRGAPEHRVPGKPVHRQRRPRHGPGPGRARRGPDHLLRHLIRHRGRPYVRHALPGPRPADGARRARRHRALVRRLARVPQRGRRGQRADAERVVRDLPHRGSGRCARSAAGTRKGRSTR